jgi:hypothetical protein
MCPGYHWIFMDASLLVYKLSQMRQNKVVKIEKRSGKTAPFCAGITGLP